MAYRDLIAALRLPKHPMARVGYGKRSVPAQEPYRQQDFGHLPIREGCIAAFIDRLPDGSAIDTKSLAKALPLYGQQAVRSALRNLAEAGHLRRVKETLGEGRPQWVQRTYFSAEPRSVAWWHAYLNDDEQEQEPPTEEPPAAPDAPDSPVVEVVEVEAEPEVEPEGEGELDAEVAAEAEPEADAEAEAGPLPAVEAGSPDAPASVQTGPVDPTPAYRALAELGGADPRLTLSAAECSALEDLAAEWFARGSTPTQFLLALTTGLPQVVHSAGALARNRLTQKMPPKLPGQPEPSRPSTLQQPVRRRVLECVDCGRPGLPEALPRGLCHTCRNDSPQLVGGRPTARELRLRVADLRQALRGGQVGGPAPA